MNTNETQEFIQIVKEELTKVAEEAGTLDADREVIDATVAELEKSASAITDAARKSMSRLKSLFGSSARTITDSADGSVKKTVTSFGDGVREQIQKTLPMLGMSASIGAGVTMGNLASNKIKAKGLRGDYEEALAFAIKTNPILRQGNRGKIERFGETIHRFAPHVSTDVNLLSAILASAVHAEVMDPQTIKSLTDLESKFRGYDQFKVRDIMA